MTYGKLSVFRLDNQDTVAVTQGTLNVSQLLSSIPGQPAGQYGYDNGRLAGGTWKVGDGGTLRIGGSISNTPNSTPIAFGPIQSLAAHVELSGPTAKFLDSNGNPALAQLQFIEKDVGTLKLLNGVSFTTGATTVLVNRGLLEIGANSHLNTPGGFEQRDGTLKVDGTLTGAVTLLGGWLRGNGVINGNTVVAANLGPGSSPGHLTINGDLQLSATSVLEIEVEGDIPGVTMDLLTVNGAVILGGNLVVKLGAGLQFSSLTTLNFLDGASGVSGSFDQVSVQGPGVAFNAATYRFAFDDATLTYVGQLDVTPVPEPEQWALLLAGCAILVWRVRRHGSSSLHSQG